MVLERIFKRIDFISASAHGFYEWLQLGGPLVEKKIATIVLEK